MPTHTKEIYNSLSTVHERQNSARALTFHRKRSHQDSPAFSQSIRKKINTRSGRQTVLSYSHACVFTLIFFHRCNIFWFLAWDKVGIARFLPSLSECSLPPPDEIQLAPSNPRGPRVQEDVNPHYASPIQTSNNLASATDCNSLSQFDAPFLSPPFSPVVPDQTSMGRRMGRAQSRATEAAVRAGRRDAKRDS